MASTSAAASGARAASAISPRSSDLVEGEAAQIAERTVAGAEIVQDDAHAELAELMQQRRRSLVVLPEEGFGDLELEAVGRQARRGQRLQHRVQKVAPQLQGDDVDRNLDGQRPARRLRE